MVVEVLVVDVVDVEVLVVVDVVDVEVLVVVDVEVLVVVDVEVLVVDVVVSPGSVVVDVQQVRGRGTSRKKAVKKKSPALFDE